MIANCPRCRQQLRLPDGISRYRCPACAAVINIKPKSTVPPAIPSDSESFTSAPLQSKFPPSVPQADQLSESDGETIESRGVHPALWVGVLCVGALVVLLAVAVVWLLARKAAPVMAEAPEGDVIAKVEEKPVAKAIEAVEKVEPKVVAKKSEPEPVDELWPDARKGPQRVGDVSVTVKEVAFDVVKLRDFRSSTSSAKKYLYFVLDIKNESETKKLVHRGWAGNDFGNRDDAILDDNFGNAHRRQGFGFSLHVVGQLKNDSIFPGKTVSDIIVFDEPIEKMTSLKLTLPASAYGGRGEFRFEIPRAMIRGLKG